MRAIAAKHRDRFKGWLDRLLEEHGAKVLVILIGLVVLLPAAITWRYLTTTAGVADEAKAAAQEAKTTTREVHHLTIVNRALTKSLQSAVVESCEQNGNQRARVQREQLHEEIHEAENPDPIAFHALVVAGVPPKAIRVTERRAIVKLERRLDRVTLVDCRSQYKISPGSGRRWRASD